MTELDPATVLRLDRWDSRYVRVLFIAQRDGLAIALVDADSDTNLVVLERGQGGEWRAGGGGSVNDEGPGMSDPAAYDYGQAEPGIIVTVDYLGLAHQVVTDENGWWTFVAPYDHEKGGLPRGRRPV